MEKEKIQNFIFIGGLVLLILGGLIAVLNGAFTPVSLTGIITGAVITAVFAFLRRGELKRAMTSRAARYGINAAIYSMLVIGIAVIVQVIFTFKSGQVDLTKNKRYTLSDQTVKVLKSMKGDVEAYYFYSVRARNGAIEDKLKQYEKITTKFTFQSVDADKNPAFAKRFNVDRYGIVVLYGRDSGSNEKVDSLSEEGITNGLIRLTRQVKKKIYFTKGHGEHSIEAPQNEKNGYSTLKAQLEDYNYEISDIELFSSPGVPADASMIIIAGPKGDFFDSETHRLKKYINTGGKILVFYQPFVSLPKLNSLIKQLGITVHNDVVVDKLGRMFGGDVLMPIISKYEQHEITKGFTVAAFFPMCRTFDLPAGVDGVTVSPLASTNPGSWGETDLNMVKKGQVSYNKGTDKESPLAVAAVADIDNSVFKADAQSATISTKAKVVLFGSSDIANNTYLGASGNRDLVLNAISYLAEEGDMISIRPKDRSFEPLFLSKVQGRMIFILPTVFVPLLVLAAGLLVFIRRRMS